MIDQVRQAVVILADGTRPDVMEELLRKGDLPGIAATLVEPGGGRGIGLASTVFPSTTGPAHLPFLTGRFPGPCNVPGIRWFDPQAYGRNPLSLSRFRSYMGPGNFLAGRDLSPSVRTLFEHIPDHACLAGNVRRGVRFTRDLTRWAKLYQNVRSFFVQDWYGLDRIVGEKLLWATKRGTRFVFAAFYSADSNGHKSGPDHPRTLAAYRLIDRAVGRLGEQLRQEGRAADTLVALVSDHGLSATSHHLDLQALVERTVGRCLAHPTLWRGLYDARAAVMVSGNSMAHVYLPGPRGWGDQTFLDQPTPELSRLLEALLSEEAVDQVIGRDSAGGGWVFSRRGRALIRRTGKDILYRTEGGDPFGYPTELAGRHRDRELLGLTWGTDYPDAPAQVLQILQSGRCGTLIVSSRPGHDLRARFERPAHVGSHGSLHRVHAMTPLLLNRPVNLGPHRTVDLHPTLLRALGEPAAPKQDGISLIG